MFSSNRSILIALILLWVSLFGFKSFAQTARPDFDIDSSKTITFTEFNQRIDRAIMLIKTKPLNEISDADHVNIMMCWNTIFMAMVRKGHHIIKHNGEKLTFQSYKKRFDSGRYHKFEKIVEKVKYTADLRKIYPEWSPSRGMGIYFHKLQMAMYGTPEPYAIFNVIE